jgi:hypothetical protein
MNRLKELAGERDREILSRQAAEAAGRIEATSPEAKTA